MPFEWLHLETDEQARSEAGVAHCRDSCLPICIFPDGTRLECPTLRQITEKLGWFRDPSRSEYDLAIYGAGASEAPLTRSEHVYIGGGGNSAGQAVMRFAPFASRVSMVVRDDSLKSTVSQYLVDRIYVTPNVEVLTLTEVSGLDGDAACRRSPLPIAKQGRSVKPRRIGCLSASAVCRSALGHGSRRGAR